MFCKSEFCVCASFSPSDIYKESRVQESGISADWAENWVERRNVLFRSKDETQFPELMKSMIESPVSALQAVVHKMGDGNPIYDVNEKDGIRVSCKTKMHAYSVQSPDNIKKNLQLARKRCAAGILNLMGITKEAQVPLGKKQQKLANLQQLRDQLKDLKRDFSVTSHVLIPLSDKKFSRTQKKFEEDTARRNVPPHLIPAELGPAELQRQQLKFPQLQARVQAIQARLTARPARVPMLLMEPPQPIPVAVVQVKEEPIGVQPYNVIKPHAQPQDRPLNLYLKAARQVPTVQIKQELIDFEDQPIGLQPYKIKPSLKYPTVPWPTLPMAISPAKQTFSQSDGPTNLLDDTASSSSIRTKLLKRRTDMKTNTAPVTESKHPVWDEEDSFIVISSWSCHESDGS